MQGYDIVMKRLLQRSVERVTGIAVVQWLPTELPAVQNLRMDLLGETEAKELIQIEVQSSNDERLPFRMLEYLVLIARSHGNRMARQILLYVGREPLRIKDRFEWDSGVARYGLIDMREVDAEPFLKSVEPSDMC